MGKKLKKGTRGSCAAYITQGESLKRLQSSLQDFRKLCIFKGVFPRNPKKKLRGKDKSYYHIKDIKYLSHEPLRDSLRKKRVHDKKIKSAIAKHDYSRAKTLKHAQPSYSLHHVLAGRYACLAEAVKDCDDAISILALLTSLPEDHARSFKILDAANDVLDRMYLYIAVHQCVRKVFCSIKGFYFQVSILNETITFMLPHQHPQRLSPEVDFKVMETFQEFFIALLQAVCFKLYDLQGLQYPPKVINSKLAHSECRYLGLQSVPKSTACEPNDDEVDQVKAQETKASNDDDAHGPPDEPGADTSKELTISVPRDLPVQSLFSGLTFFLSRGVPKLPLTLMLQSCGADLIGWHGIGSLIEERSLEITHYVIDRPLTEELKASNFQFIQPQWILDSINQCTLLPVWLYGPEASLPPHYSPFDDSLEQTKSTPLSLSAETLSSENLSGALGEEGESAEKAFFDSFNQEKEKTFSSQSTCKESKQEVLPRKNEDLERQRAMLSKKHKRLLERIEVTLKVKI